MNGRVSRLQFFGLGFYFFSFFAPISYFGYSDRLLMMFSPLILITLLFLVITALTGIVTFSIRRLHDMDKSAWYTLLLATGPGAFVLFFMLLFKPGTDGPNQFGSDPCGTINKDSLQKSCEWAVLLALIGFIAGKLLSSVSSFIGK
ncbi:MAG: DUF805 domain-containing protein [bacterium]|nr:DUF805 domain-containing protein [bacterium]